MKRYLYLFPLMAFTAATLSLSACDDKKKEEQASTETAAPETTAPAPDTAMTAAAPAAALAVQAEGANAYATAEGATTGAVFLTLHNPGADADKLMTVKTDAATISEIHESYVDDAGTMQMRKVDSVDIPAGQQVTLKPDGYHIMLMGLTKPLVEGETFNVTLTFEKAPEVTLPVTITAAGGASTSATPAPADATDHSAMTPSDTSTAMPATEATPDTTTPAPSESATPPETTDTTAAPAPTTSDAPGTTTDSTTAPSDSTSGDAKSAQ